MTTSVEDKFAVYLASTEQYFAKVVSEGDKPWWMDDERLASLERFVPGITSMSPVDRRKSLFYRHRGSK